jgi:hypothetical protein
VKSTVLSRYRYRNIVSTPVNRLSRATVEVNQISMYSSFSLLTFKTMDVETLRNLFSGPDRRITLEQYHALGLDELSALIRDAGLCRPDAGEARLYHPSSAPTCEIYQCLYVSFLSLQLSINFILHWNCYKIPITE